MAKEQIVINGFEDSTRDGEEPIPPVYVQTATNNPVEVAFHQNNDLTYDAWGRQKVVNDFSLFHGMWTYSIPDRIWEECSVNAGVLTPIPQAGTNCQSVDNMLEVRSGTVASQGACLHSKRHPRYQPNRGHLYSTACILPDALTGGTRRFGLFKDGTGVYFELEGEGDSYTLYAVRKSAGVVKMREAVTLPAGYDPENGHVYDIQYQWRGLGNYKFFIDLQEVYHDNILGTLTELSMRLPALPAGFESITANGTEIKIQCGCVDITSEGGMREGRQFASVSTGTNLIDVDSNGTATIGVYLPREVDYNGDTVLNTRDLVASKLSGWTRDEAAVQVWFARDIMVPNLAGLTWTDMIDSTATQLIGGKNSALDDAFQLDRGNMMLVLNEWDDIEKKNVVLNPEQDAAPFYITPGDILMCVVQSFAGTDDNATTLYLSEEL